MTKISPNNKEDLARTKETGANPILYLIENKITAICDVPESFDQHFSLWRNEADRELGRLGELMFCEW